MSTTKAHDGLKPDSQKTNWLSYMSLDAIPMYVILVIGLSLAIVGMSDGRKIFEQNRKIAIQYRENREILNTIDRQNQEILGILRDAIVDNRLLNNRFDFPKK